MGLRLFAILLLIAPTLQARSLPVSGRCTPPMVDSVASIPMSGCNMTMAGDPCGCCAAPSDQRQPDEPMPTPTRSGDLLVTSLTAPPTPIAELDWSVVADPIPAGEAGLHPATHNVVQALLGIWRT